MTVREREARPKGLIYLCPSYRERGDKRRRTLLKEALTEYCKEYRTKGLQHSTDPSKIRDLTVSVDAAGKPFFDGDAKSVLPLFSISHTGNLWGCVFSIAPIGFDLQETRPVDQEAIARRFFSEQEGTYVRTGGAEAFFTVWTLREALAKCKGIPLLRLKDSVISPEGALQAVRIQNGEYVYPQTGMLTGCVYYAVYSADSCVWEPYFLAGKTQKESWS